MIYIKEFCRLEVHLEFCFQVRDVEMSTKSLVEAKKSADLENQELRKMLKKELEASPKFSWGSQSGEFIHLTYSNYWRTTQKI